MRARPVHEKRQSVCSRFRLMMNSVCNVRPAALQKAKTLTVLTLYRASASGCNRLRYRGLSKDRISSSYLPHVRKKCHNPSDFQPCMSENFPRGVITLLEVAKLTGPVKCPSHKPILAHAQKLKRNVPRRLILNEEPPLTIDRGTLMAAMWP